MDELERAVIDAALAWWASWEQRPVAHHPTFRKLWDAAQALMNAQSDEHELRWVARTMRDVRPGDEIRMPSAPDLPAKVLQAGPLIPWRVQEGANRFEDTMVAHDRMPLMLEYGGRQRRINMLADMPVEIQMTGRELEAVELVGWSNRVRVAQYTAEA